jgi:cysteine synthase
VSVLNQIGNTPLVEYQGDVPKGNKIWFKLECNNPFGSHYDRVYLKLYEHFVREGLLKEDSIVLETTSGTAGVSFSAIGRLLGYKCRVVIPEGGEKAREEAIKREGAEIIFTPAEEYVNAFPRFLKRYLARNREVVFLNHSMGPNGSENVVTTSALAQIAIELRRQLDQIDYFIAAVGNGSSILGPGRVLKDTTKIVTFETFQSAVAYDLMYPEKYAEEYGIPPGTLPRHRLPGTSFRGILFPHIHIAFEEERLVAETYLVSDKLMDEQYHQQTGWNTTEKLPHWDEWNIPYGRSTRAGLAVAMEVAWQVSNKSIVVLAYDKPERYDT